MNASNRTKDAGEICERRRRRRRYLFWLKQWNPRHGNRRWIRDGRFLHEQIHFCHRRRRSSRYWQVSRCFAAWQVLSPMLPGHDVPPFTPRASVRLPHVFKDLEHSLACEWFWCTGRAKKVSRRSPHKTSSNTGRFSYSFTLTFSRKLAIKR